MGLAESMVISGLNLVLMLTPKLYRKKCLGMCFTYLLLHNKPPQNLVVESVITFSWL